MSVGSQFKRIGETGAAFGLWAIIIWIFSKPLRAFITLAIVISIIIGLLSIFDDTGDVFYVNINKLELVDRPFGKTFKVIEMNDSVVLVENMSDNWFKVAYHSDTLYFHENFYNDKYLGYFNKIQKTQFTKFKALKGMEVTLSHPDGYFDNGHRMMKNGDIIKVQRYIDYDNMIEYREGGTNKKISVKHVKIDWKPILNRYPKLKESN